MPSYTTVGTRLNISCSAIASHFAQHKYQIGVCAVRQREHFVGIKWKTNDRTAGIYMLRPTQWRVMSARDYLPERPLIRALEQNTCKSHQALPGSLIVGRWLLAGGNVISKVWRLQVPRRITMSIVVHGILTSRSKKRLKAFATTITRNTANWITQHDKRSFGGGC
jgi:hypothetical protein